MARRSGFIAVMAQMQRDAQRRQVAATRNQQAAARTAMRAQREYERSVALDEKERKKLYIEARLAEVEEDNETLEYENDALRNLLTSSLSVDHRINSELLKLPFVPLAFNAGDLAINEPLLDLASFLPSAPTGISKLLSSTKRQFEADYADGQRRYAEAQTAFELRSTERQEKLIAAQLVHDASELVRREEIDQHNNEINEMFVAYADGQSAAVLNLVAIVLGRSEYPERMPQRNRLAYVPESKQLVIELELPDFSIVPSISGYKYVKSGDTKTETASPMTQRKQIYTSIVAQVVLRTLHEIFSSDEKGFIETIVLNGHVETVDPGTGKSIHPCLISLRTTRDSFGNLDLERVEPIACLKNLGAGVSKSPAELVPIRPILDFSMVDPRFIEEQDILSNLDQRPNLMSLSPSEFESLITNLFQKMGLDTKLTQASRDGGVDCIAYDPRPILGGKVVIQAKRYKNTVGVSAVRDLFGTMHNEGATKGILVTTSGYGKASFDFASNKPLELLDGANLLYLLNEHAGISAKIEPPDDWVDPHESG